MNKEKQLIKNTAIVSIGKICTQLITFFLLPLYTALLTTEQYGVVDLMNTLVALFLPIVTLQIEQGIFRYLIDSREDIEGKRKIITTSMLFITIQSVLYLVIFFIASSFINNEYKYFLATNLIAGMFSTILLQISRGLGDNFKYAVGSFISGVVIVVLNVIFIAGFKWGAYGMLAATLIGNVSCAIYIFFSKKIYTYIKIKNFEKSTLKEMLKYSIPLVPNMISWWVVDASNRTIVSSVLGVGMNGILSAATKFSNVISTLYSVFNLTWTESAAINIDSEDRDEFFSKILDFIIRFFGALILGIIAFMPFVFSIMINDNFGNAYYQIPILMLGSIFNIGTSFLGSIYVAKKITKEIAKTSILAAIINLVLCLSLVNFIGLYAASIATAISYFAMTAYRAIDSRKYVKLKVNKNVVISYIIILIITIVFYYIQIKPICLVLAIIVAIYAVVINKNSIKFILNLLNKKRKDITDKQN